MGTQPTYDLFSLQNLAIIPKISFNELLAISFDFDKDIESNRLVVKIISRIGKSRINRFENLSFHFQEAIWEVRTQHKTL